MDGDYTALADQLVEEILEIEEEMETIDKAYERRLKLLDEKRRAELDTLESRADYKKFLLKEIWSNLKVKRTKTQDKVELISGDIFIKHPKCKYVPNKLALIEELRDVHPEFVKTSTIESLDWAGLKEHLKIQNDVVVLDYNGDNMELKDITLEIIEEEMVVGKK